MRSFWAFCLFAFLSACFPADAETRPQLVGIVSSLVDPQKLATLSVQDRSINERFKKLLYYLYVAEAEGYRLEEIVNDAYDELHVGKARRLLTIEMLRYNFDASHQAEVFSSEANLEALKHGKSPRLTYGGLFEEIGEVDHIVPISRFPEFGNDIANLQLISRRANLSKGDRMGPNEFTHLEKLRAVYSSELETKRILREKAAREAFEKARRLTTLQLLSRDYIFSLPPRWSRIDNQVFFDGDLIIADLRGEVRRRKISEEKLIDESARAARAQKFAQASGVVHWKFVRDPRLRFYTEAEVKEFYAAILGRSFDSDAENEKRLKTMSVSDR